jgi:hypothetical protein
MNEWVERRLYGGPLDGRVDCGRPDFQIMFYSHVLTMVGLGEPLHWSACRRDVYQIALAEIDLPTGKPLWIAYEFVRTE